MSSNIETNIKSGNITTNIQMRNIISNIIGVSSQGSGGGGAFSLTIFEVTTKEVTLNWTFVQGADYYNLERSVNSNFSGAIQIYSGALLSFQDTGLTSNTTYYYRIRPIVTGQTPGGWTLQTATTLEVINSLSDVIDTDEMSWYNAYTGVTLGAGNIASLVVDQGGKARNWTPVSGFEPVVMQDENGRDFFRFTNHAFQMTISNWSTVATDYLMLVVQRYQGGVPGAGEGRLFSMVSATRLTGYSLLNSNVPNKFAMLANAGAQVQSLHGPIPGALNIMEYDYSNPLKMRQNGIEIQTTDEPYVQQTLTNGSPAIIGRTPSATNPSVIDLYEFVLIAGTYSDLIKSQVRGYFEDIYSDLLYNNKPAWVDNGKEIEFVSEVELVNTTGADPTQDYIFGCNCYYDESFRLHIVYNRSSNHNNSFDQKVIYRYSDDDGLTVSSEQVLKSSSDPLRYTTGGIFKTSTGRLLHRYHIIDTSDSSVSAMMEYSDNGGTTWNEITGDGDAGLITHDYDSPGQLSGPGRPFEFDGDIYLPLYGRTTGSGSRECVLYKSTDDGDTWSYFSQIAPIDFDDYEEPSVVINEQGIWIALLRSDPRDKTFIVFSWDNGVTWSLQGSAAERPQAFESVGFPGCGVSPNNGVLSYGRATLANTYRTRVHYSSNGGYDYTTQNHGDGSRSNWYMYGNFDWSPRLQQFIGVHAEEITATPGVGPCAVYSTRYREIDA